MFWMLKYANCMHKPSVAPHVRHTFETTAWNTFKRDNIKDKIRYKTETKVLLFKKIRFE